MTRRAEIDKEWPLVSLQLPAFFNAEYLAPAILLGKSCRLAKALEPDWSKVLFAAGVPLVYPTVAAYLLVRCKLRTFGHREQEGGA